MKLQGQVAVVTGAARGLGRAYALRLAHLGADVAVVDINLDGAAQFDEHLDAPSVADEIRAMGRRSIGIQADLSDRQAAQEAIRRCAAELGRLDVLVNNAGGSLTPIERSQPATMPDEDIQATFAANLWSTIYCCQAAAPIMTAQHSGSIINTSSLAGHMIPRGGRLSHYGAAKAAVTHYTRSLASELAPSGVRVNCIAPGTIETSRIKAQANARGIGDAASVRGVPMGRFGTPEDCAGVIEFLATDLSSYVTGQCIAVCGGALLSPS